MTCENVRENLLAHLYGALDAAEERVLEDHLAACPACRAALEEAREEAGILREAARLSATDLEFRAPAPRRARRILTLPRLAAAAVLLVAALGVWTWRASERAPVLAAHPRLTVQGPAGLEPDAPAVFLVRTETIDGDPLPAAVKGRVFRGGRTALAESEGETGEDGTTELTFPAGLGKPGETLALGVAADLGDSRSETTAVLFRDTSRLLAYLTTDKPLYRPGEPVRVRAVVLTRANLTPAGTLVATLALEDPRENEVAKVPVVAKDGSGGTELYLPPGIPGGVYRLTLREPRGAFPEVDREITVRAYRVPRLRTDVELSRDSFGPGDEGRALLSVERAEGGVPEGAKVTAVVTVDGAEVSREEKALDATGDLSYAFTLPEEIEAGRGLVTFAIDDGGNVETAAETIPIVLDRLDVALYPEGGDLVAGLPGRVYFSVRDPKGEPADLRADVVDGEGRVVAEARVDTLGMGRFDLAPIAGETYRLVPRRPAGATLMGAEIAPVAGGVALKALDAEVPAGGEVRVEVASTEAGEHTVAAWCRGVLLAQESVDLEAGVAKTVALRPATGAGGVVRVTVTDAAGVPRAERLVARAPARRIDVGIDPRPAEVSPGGKVTVDVTTKDETGAPVPAVLGVSVVDDAVLALADDEDTAPMPMHFLLGLEVRELEKVEKLEGKPEAVDLLLGVQGWRRFCWKDPKAFVAENPDAGPRVAPVTVGGDLLVRVDNLESARGAAAAALTRIDRRTVQVGAALLLVGGLLLSLLWLVRRPAGSLALRLVPAYGVALAAAAVLLVPALSGTAPALVLVDVNTDGFDGAPLNEVTVFELGEEGRPDRWTERFSVPSFSGVLPDETVRLDPRWPYSGYPANLERNPNVGGAEGGGQGTYSYSYYSSSTYYHPYYYTYTSGGGGGGGGGAVEMTATAPLVLGMDGVEYDLYSFRTLEIPPGTTVRFAPHGPNRPVTLLSPMNVVIGGTIDVGGGYRSFYLAREYAHVRRASDDGVRRDFSEVLYWNPRLETGADGKGSFSFDTSDSVTSFRVGVEANDSRGALAAASATIENRAPFYLEPKLPPALAAKDRLRLPVAVANATDAGLAVSADLSISGDLLSLTGEATRTVQVAAGARERLLYDLRAKQGLGRVALAIEGKEPDGLADRSERTIDVYPRGYPIQVDRSGVLAGKASAEFLLPPEMDRSTLRGGLILYPTMLADLTDGLESMLRSPHGCFEQASSSTYPNVLILTLLSEEATLTPALARTAKSHLDAGYSLLTGYECEHHGYEWFGKDPGHEALTAYGLMEFTDMARVRDVDPAMVARTREWLLSRRDGKGGFRSAGGCDSFASAPREIHHAYVCWALTEAGMAGEIGPELDLLERRASASDDPYVVALGALATGKAGRPGASDLVAKLAGMQAEDGSFAGGTTSITSSRGRNLAVETTALAALALLRSPEHLAQGESAVRSLLESRRGGGFGATQATILALRALVEYERRARRTATSHDLTLFVNGRAVASRHVPAGQPGAVRFEAELTDALVPGRNEVEIRTTGGEELPWSLSLAYHTSVPPSSPGCAVGVATALGAAKVAEGETVGLTVTIRNREDGPLPMVLARIGLPAGLEPRAEELTERRDAGDFDFFETRPRELTLYLRGMAAGEKREVRLDLVAAYPGEFEGPASSAYLYYTDDERTFTAPLRIEVAPR